MALTKAIKYFRKLIKFYIRFYKIDCKILAENYK